MKARTHITRFTIVMALAVLAVGVFAGAALAVGEDTQATDVDATIQGANLDISSALGAGDFGTITLTGAADATNAGATGFGDFVVVDPRGTGAGWTVTLEATVLTDGTHPFAAESLTCPQLTLSSSGSGSSVLTNLAYEEASPIDVEGGVEMLTNSTAGEGMGTYTFSAPAASWNLAVSADEYAGAYTTTITTTLAPYVAE